MKKGGKVAAKAFAKGGIVRSAKPTAKPVAKTSSKPVAKTSSKPKASSASRGDGCAQRGKTRGRYC
jgi:hypothetical protein